MQILIIEKTPSQIFSKKLVNIKYSLLIIDDLKKIDQIKNRELKEYYLLNSYIINLTACWQTFIQDLLKYSINKMFENAPNKVLQTALSNNLNERLKRFNTPSTENIDELFKNILGIEKITSQVSNASVSKKNIKNTLEIRHKIAHKGTHTENLNKESAFARMKIIYNFSVELENIVLIYISSFKAK